MDTIAMTLGKGGFLLFTAGLVLGAAIPRFLNPRMALSAHLTAVQMGTALIAFALFWPQFGIACWAEVPIGVALLASSWLLVASLALAAALGASRVLPIAGKGFAASPAREVLVAVGTIGSSALMLIACLAVCLFLLID